MRADVVIVGAGTAGAAAARLCARRGMSVICLERGPLDAAGARWINGVPAWAFDEAGIERPEPPERLGGGQVFHLVAGLGPRRVSVRGHDVLEVDMRALVARLQSSAAAAGARLLGDCRVLARDGLGLQTTAGRIEGSVLVDASGLAGARLLQQTAIPGADLCAAAQELRELADPSAAKAWFDSHGVAWGDTLCFTGVAGGYSVLNVRCGGDHVALLTGSVPAQGFPSGLQILRRFAAEHGWVGPTLFGGSRVIPLRRPRDVIAKEGVALLGDAACQVFPAHGSGIGPGLVAASVLAEELSAGRGVLGYQLAWMRRWGGLLAAWDLFRRFSQTLSASDIAALMRAGLLDEAGSRDGLDQRFPGLHAHTLPAKLRGVLREPGKVAALAPILLRMAAVRALYARYPADPARLAAWSRRAARFCGDDPA